MSEWSMETPSKSVKFMGSNPIGATIILKCFVCNGHLLRLGAEIPTANTHTHTHKLSHT